MSASTSRCAFANMYRYGELRLDQSGRPNEEGMVDIDLGAGSLGGNFALGFPRGAVFSED